MGVLATLSIPMTYLMVNTLTRRRRAALLASAFLALAPGFVLFFPMLDPIYVVFSCAMIVVWHEAVARDSARLAAVFGVVLGIATFWTYLVLILAPFLLFAGILCTGHTPGRALEISIRRAFPALGAFVGFYLLLWLVTGFNPVATFFEAWKNQQLFVARHAAARKYPLTVPFDLLDFLLGAGWISLLLIAMTVLRTRRGDAHFALVLLCIGQVVFVALAGLLQAETARVWCFMMPLWLLPAGLELESWDRRHAVAALATLWLITAAIGQNMVLISP
jgi:hypothetical protein